MRDLFRSEIDELESIMDTAGLQAILEALSEICGAKSEHLLTNWQDSAQAKLWATAEGAIGVLSTTDYITAVS